MSANKWSSGDNGVEKKDRDKISLDREVHGWRRRRSLAAADGRGSRTLDDVPAATIGLPGGERKIKDARDAIRTSYQYSRRRRRR